ncbi:MAG: hypothetical protein JWQ19_1666 [Subtercola sp.]|nr:hypothetical protein [Subtercola sp.]
MDLESVARELYRLPPAEFTAARNARAKEIAAEGDRVLAAAVRSLARASAAAWAVNRVSAEWPELEAEVVQLGETLRQAQEHPHRQTLTELGEQRKALGKRVTAQAAQLAEQNDVGLSDVARSEIEQTFFAAIADRVAAAVVFSGRLIRSLQSTGFEEVDVSGAVGGPAVDSRRELSGTTSVESASAERAAAATAADSPESDRAAESAKAAEHKRAHDDAVRAADAAGHAAREAQQKAEALADALSGCDREARDVAAQIDDLEAQLEELHDRQRELAAHQRSAEHDHRTAVVTARRAARDADDAAARAAELA